MTRASTTDEAVALARAHRYHVIYTKLGRAEADNWRGLVDYAAEHCPGTFIIVWSHTAVASAAKRWAAFERGANMVSCNTRHVAECLDKIVALETRHRGELGCPLCGVTGLNSDGLFVHAPLFHIAAPNKHAKCPICGVACSPILAHIVESHTPAWAPPHVGRSSPRLAAFALVVCIHPRTGKMLLVQEFCSVGFWLPGGGVDAGEDLDRAAIRETMEEAGVAVRLTGVLRFEFTPSKSTARLRVIFLAEPVDASSEDCKTIPDFESCGAVWVSPEDILSRKLIFRGREPVQWMQYLQAGGKAAPMSVLGDEYAQP